MFKHAIFAMAVISFILALAVPAHAASITLFYDNFDGGTGDLNGTTPDVTTGGASWVAASVFKANGSFTQTGDLAGSATVSFTPASGFVYTLDASVSGVTDKETLTYYDWIALGFANGQSTDPSTNNRFVTGNVMGVAWMLLKGDASSSSNSALLGVGTGTNGGLTSPEAWSDFTYLTDPGDFDLRIVLDTTGGTGNWTATWYAKPSAVGSYTQVRPTATVLTESNFTSVGFALAGGDVNGAIESFTLTSDIPEPTTAMSLLVGACWLVRRRKANA